MSKEERDKEELLRALQPKAVKIPATLIKKLKPFGPRYIKVSKPILGQRRTGKGAVEPRWQDHPYEADDPEIQIWLKAGNNYGVVCGKGIIEIDIDDPTLAEKFLERDTFTVQSGSGKGHHFYFRSDITDNGTVLEYDEEGKQKNLGNIQARNKYVVGPGCNHYTGGTYEIIKNVPIRWISKEEVEEIFKDKLTWSTKQRAFNERDSKREEKKLGFKIPISDIIDLSKLKQITADEWQGPHPVHGSTTGVNFCVNIDKNVWHCFRCSSGGGPLSWLAVREGLIKCEESRKGILKGDLFWKAAKIAEEEGFDIDLQKLKKKTEVHKKYFTGSPPKFNHAKMANELMEKFYYVTRIDNKVMYVYNPEKGIYKPNGEDQIKGEIQKILGEYSTIHRQNEVINFIRNFTYKEIEESPIHLLALQNGLFDIFTRELKPFSPEYFILNALPVYYDPNADCPVVKKFVSEIVLPDDVVILQKLAGYCLLKDTRFHKAFMLTGEGANGKSTFLELLRSMLGKENVSTVPLHEFERSRFATATLYGKMANIYPDLSDIALKKTGVFKTLTGGDTIMAENKYQNIFFFIPYAKLVFSANKVPETLDDTTAFFRRWVIINFPNQFLPDDPKTDKNILQKLTTKEELPGFFNWALEGLTMLLEDNGFQMTKTVEETREQYIRASSPVKAFAMDCIEQKAGEVISKDKVYEAFINYCRKHGLPSVAKNVFSMKLAEFVPGVTESRIRVNGKRVLAWRDITLIGTAGTTETILFPQTPGEKELENSIGVKDREEDYSTAVPDVQTKLSKSEWEGRIKE